MATSNRDRIGEMFDVLAPALNRFIARAVEPELPDGAGWVRIVAAVDNTMDREHNPDDPYLQLKLLSQNYTGRFKKGWYPFRGQLNRLHEAYAGELFDVRNAWAHMKSFTDDDAYRALDTAERLANAIGAGDAAVRIERIRLNLRRVTADKDDRRTLKTAAETAESTGLKPWREVLRPHDDVATGNFQASEFAADLFKVAQGAAANDYADPVQFFARTYLTEGLRDLVQRAVRRLRGDDNASPVINLQTNFGGGKTHSMLALWHLAGGTELTALPQETQDLLGPLGYEQITNARRVAIVGNHFAPTGEVKTDGTIVRTLWGELAWQLGGAPSYALVADADRAGTNPGRALHDLLAAHAPAVILIDEWVAYARQLPDDPDDAAAAGITGGTFDTQFTFAQSLTEAAKSTKGVLLAISIPAAETGDDPDEPVAGNVEEVGGRRGLDALQRLQNVVRRVADQWRPASSDEAYHIVRQRLFVTPDAAALASIRAAARAFVEFYRRYADEFPREARDSDYEDRIKRTFPIHPELFDRLYEDWSSLERFQRTRGVLRLMNTVIHALWVGEDSGPLIMPGSIPIAASSVNSELTQYLQDSWKAVIDADVDGPNAEPTKIDHEKPLLQSRRVTKRLARTVFFGAAPTLGSAHKGLERQRVFLGTAIPGDIPGNFHSALAALTDRATYFYSGAGKYWYDLQANITRRARDQAERLHDEDVWAEICARLVVQEKHPGDFAAVHICPDDSGDISNIDEARLVILHPKAVYKKAESESKAMTFAQAALEYYGAKHRTRRNMLVFLAPDVNRMEELDSAVRDYLAWSRVLDDADELDLTQNQKNQAAERKASANDTVHSRLLGTYHWALVPRASDPAAASVIEPVKAEGQSPWLAERVSKRLAADGDLATQQAAAAISHWLMRLPRLWEAGHVRVGDLWEQYATYPYMPRLRDRSVLIQGIAEQPLLWENEGFAVALAFDGERYEGLRLPSDGRFGQVTDSMLLVKPSVAVEQRRRELAERTDFGGEGSPNADRSAGTGDEEREGHGTDSAPGCDPGSGAGSAPNPKVDYFFGSKTLDPAHYGLDFKRLMDEVIQHLAGTPGVDLKVRVEIEATTSLGFSEFRVRTISENSSALKFDQAGFEEGTLGGAG
ncbi:Swt1 family HEPN domain-containing protein [Dactylosporangium sp. NPDC000521]|uniref:Swt1 family HEPN domain-containing protein n=1 Tax=Dactylosporangium sp. NPDC000521 TaxID=3363975 RepID=UPI003698F4E2